MNKTTLTTLLLTIFFSLNLVAQNTYFVKVGGNNNGGLTEENAFTTVNNAVVAASDGDIITIVGAINQTGQVGIGKSISFVGQSNATITGASARMYVINTAGKTISFTNITFQDATTTNPGAVITITQNSDLTLTGCILKNNTSTVNGGTILAGGTGVITITNSLFDGNSANRGGAVAVTSDGRQLIVTGSTFVNNTATGIDGGALYLAGNNNLSSITNTTIFNNQVNNTQDPSKGGGVKIEGTRPFTIQNSLIYGNFVTNGTTDVPSDLGVIANVELNLINSLTKKITPNLAADDSFATSIVAADLTASNLSFDSTTGNVIYDAVAVGTESPIDFGSDGEDAGSWNSGLNFLDTTIPVITLEGEPSVTVEVGTSYTDAGATASDNIDGDITSNIITVNTVDTTIVASYTVTYNVSDASGNAAVEVTRTVNVVDTFAQNTYFVKVGGNNNGGLTEENAFTTVNNAVVAASDGDIITIVGAINQTGQVGIGKSISFVGQSNATITGASARMYVINTAGKTISFTNITFQDATTTNPGAVITITQNSDLTLTGCILKNNTSTVNGGTILAGGTGVITITNSLFDGNSANRGGAVAVTSDGRQLIVTGSTFVNNTATGIDGGALYLAGNNNLSSITNTTIFNNQVNNTQDPSKGGGVKIEGTRPFTIQNSLIYGNFVTNGTTDVPSDLGVIANVELNLINSLTKKITPNLAADDSFATSIVAADLTASNLSFDSTTGNVIYDAVAVGTESPIDFGSDGEDAGSWNSGLTLLPPDTTIPVITLEGEPSVTVEVGTSYTDAGATASDNIDGDITSNIITVNTVDTTIVASYTVTYNVSDASGNAAVEVTRTVNVVDTTIPVITLTGTAIVTIEAGTAYVDGGATATDNYDDDTTLTASIVTDVSTVDTQTVGSYTVTYNVSDASGNAATEVTRTVNVVDTTIPVITLTGTAIVTIEVGTAYVDGGATATDNYDDDTTLTASIVTDVSTVDTQTVGSYTVTYNVSDASGNAATEVTRTVNVVDTTIPLITLTGTAIVTIEVGTAYVDGGATATDNYDDDTTLTASIVTDVSTVDTQTVGSYTVTYNVSDASGNTAVEVTRTVIVEDSSLSSIDGDNETLKFIMYPNPTSDKLYIKGLNNYDLKVYNRLGQIILKANNTHAIDVSSLSVGIYLIEVSDGVKSSTKRFVKY